LRFLLYWSGALRFPASMRVPGTYRLTYNLTAHILWVQGLDQNSKALFTEAAPSADGDGPGKLVFNCYGKTCYLARVWQGGQASSRGLQLQQTGQQRRLAFFTRVVPITAGTKGR